MTVDDVISQAVRDLEPVAPLSLPGVRASRWGLLALAGGALVVAGFGVRADIWPAAATLTFQAHAVLVLIATMLAAGAALALAVPGEPSRPWRVWAPLLAAVAWGAWLTAEWGPAILGGDRAALRVDSGWGCVAKALTFWAVPGVVLVAMLARSAVLDVRRALLCAGLAVAGVGALGVQLTCSKTATMHLIVWHAGPVLLLTATAALAGAPLFSKWLRRSGWRGDLR